MPTYKVSWTKYVHVMIEADSSEDAYQKWSAENHDIGFAIALSRAATDAAKKLAKELEK